ncbi:xylulokinase [Lentzea flaviverrucosa]|uniref:Xylulose kinase n=1 Tax=Lentzea flaviverrucosa TaxID=200379 RepID=A0A1H9XXA7_9PSEU|nr:xylulokinase [Lentzea flaviverrucosa]RDI17157.1 xylulokinase [Lentzea flaviverrucosa]SES50771.1 xylulokinase [Lentzea flaviverrucosa]
MTLVAGVDSSTQSCKVVVRDAETGRLVREGRAAHPDGTEVHPSHWWSALQSALADAGGLDDVAALSVAGQQHGMVCLDEDGEVVREALLWNDTRSAAAAASLTDELGADAWAARIGLVPVASFTITKLRWLAQHEPDNAQRTAAVCLPHDWLTWRLRGTGSLADLVTDRSDASGTGYFDSVSNSYVPDLLSLALGRSDVVLPRVLGPAEWRDGPSRLVSGAGGRRDETVRLGAGAGDNAAAMLGVGGGTDVVVSLGTSGVVTATSEVRAADASGIVAGFADATGRYLPLACTLNAARVLDATARMLGVDLARLSDLALSAKPGAEGVVLVPYLEGERTPNLPDATGALHGLTLTNATPANIARAAVEGMLCGLAVGLDALAEQGADVTGVRLVGGAAVSPAVREIAPMVFGVPVTVPAPDEYVANGAARQAAWTLTGGTTPPEWTLAESTRYEAKAVPEIRARYGDAAQRYLSR